MKKLITTLKKLNIQSILYVDTIGHIPDGFFELIHEYVPNVLIIVISSIIRYHKKHNHYFFVYRPTLDLNMLFKVDLFNGPKSFINDLSIKNYKYALFLINYIDQELEDRQYFYFPSNSIKKIPIIIQNLLVNFKIFRDKTFKYELVTCKNL